MKVKVVSGGVCAAKGFKANGIHCGIRKNRTKRDLSLIVSEAPAAAAAVYTTNLVKGAPLLVTKKHLENGCARAIVCNSGNANTCNANGIEVAEATCEATAKVLGIDPDDVIVASTGVIGQPLDVTPIENGLPALAAGLTDDGSGFAAEGIMTTDTIMKEVAVEFTLSGKTCKIGGIANGSGMIHPNLATMLVFITTDAAISPKMLQRALSTDVRDTFNMVSIDGDTSTNDMLSVMTNGMAGNKEITEKGVDYDVFYEGLLFLCQKLSKMIARDGEGATKLLEACVTGAPDKLTARTAAKSVISSNLTKAAMFGADANWGRVLCALGYAKCDLDVNKIDIAFKSKAGSVEVCKGGAGVPFSEEEAKKVLSEDEIVIDIKLNDGDAAASAYGCDLTYEYVRINGDYRT